MQCVGIMPRDALTDIRITEGNRPRIEEILNRGQALGPECRARMYLDIQEAFVAGAAVELLPRRILQV